MKLVNLLYDVENGTGIVQFNRPNVLNALNSEVLRELDGLMAEIRNDPMVGVVILTGAGEKAFVAGADIPVLEMMDVREAKEFARLGQGVFQRIADFEKPVIAAINGFAFGGGLELAMACDIRIASEKAKFGAPEVKLGTIPGFGGTQRLPRLVGEGMAKLLIFSGESIDAQEALRVGLVQKVVPHEALLDKAKRVAATINERSSSAVRLAKASINQGLDVDIRTGNEIEAHTFAHSFATEDLREGVRAFMEKRTPQFSGRYTKPVR